MNYIVYNWTDGMIVGYTENERFARTMASWFDNTTYRKLGWFSKQWHRITLRFR